MILQEAFRSLISHRAWYKPSGVDPRLALRDKANFLKGKSIPEWKMRMYLSAAGWLRIQQEEWNENSPQSVIKNKSEHVG